MSTLKALFWVAVVAFVVWAGFQIAPIYMNNMGLQDAMQTEARFAGPNSTITDEILRDRLMKKVTEGEIPLTREQIKIFRQGTEVMIWAHYQVPVDLKFTKITLKFDPGTEKRPAVADPATAQP